MTKQIACPLCNKQIQLESVFIHGDRVHKLKREDVHTLILKKSKSHACDICNEIFVTKKSLTKHKEVVHAIKKEKIVKSVKCEICGMAFVKYSGVARHIKKHHPNITKEEYFLKFIYKSNKKPSCKCCDNPVKFIDLSNGYNDFCSLSCSTLWYAKNTDRIKKAMRTLSDRKKTDKNCQLGPCHLQYWINKGFSREDAAEKVKERQRTFTLEKCIKKYGEIQGKEVYQKRQEKWQNTIKSKSKEEIERINRAKMWKTRSFSFISQELFWSLYEKIKNFNITIRFAELDKNGEKNITGKNNEYCVHHKDSTLSFLDFFIPELNFCIEFDGDYWHGEKMGNQTREKIREMKIIESVPGITIIHIKEKDYILQKDIIVDFLFNEIKKRIFKNETSI